MLRTTAFGSGSRILFPQASFKYGKKARWIVFKRPLFLFCNEPVVVRFISKLSSIWSPKSHEPVCYSFLLSFYLFLFLSSIFSLQFFLVLFLVTFKEKFIVQEFRQRV